MSAPSLVDRRGFVAGCVVAAGVLLLPSSNVAAAEAQPLRALSVIVDPAIEAAAAFDAALSRNGGESRALRGDRYRFMRNLLSAGTSPTAIAGVSTYTDFVVITDALREARYDLVSYGLHSASRPDHQCFGQLSGCEPTLLRSGAMWPAALANVIAGRTTHQTSLEQPTAFSNAGSRTLLSWVVLARSLRRIA